MLEPQARPRPHDHARAYGHCRHRITSSNILPGQGQPQAKGGNMSLYLAQPSPAAPYSRRSPLVNTISTASSTLPPAAYRNSSSTHLRRSISSRSGGTITQPTGYVAMLRKQKATVWCDRAQYEDPGLAGQQRAAKMRANLEVVGGP